MTFVLVYHKPAVQSYNDTVKVALPVPPMLLSQVKAPKYHVLLETTWLKVSKFPRITAGIAEVSRQDW